VLFVHPFFFSYQRKSKKEVPRRSLSNDVHVSYQMPVVAIADAWLPTTVDRFRADVMRHETQGVDP